MSTILTIDPSMEMSGLLLSSLATYPRLLAARVIETELKYERPKRGPRGGKPKKAYALVRVHDDARRGRKIHRELLAALREWRPGVIAFEAPLGSIQPKTAADLARANQAVVDAIAAYDPELRPLFVSSYAAKEAATGRKRPDDAKDEVRRAVRTHWGPDAWDRILAEADITTKKAREAVYDASAVLLCALEQPVVRGAIEDYARTPAQKENACQR